ncbi:hypothetical protein ACYPKM_03470 [Pseudomonas aeruginosa]
MSLRLDDIELSKIFKDYEVDRLPEVFGTGSLNDMNEILVDIFQSAEWKDAGKFTARNDFIQAIRNVSVDSDDHRRVFRAMALSTNAHAVAAYLHMLKRKDNVFLADHSALITADDLSSMLRARGSKMGAVVHFLSRTVTAGHGNARPELWKALTKAYDPSQRYRERFQEAMKNLVHRWGLDGIGISPNGQNADPFVKQFFNSHDERTKDISAAILAGLMSKGILSKEKLMEGARDASGRMRLVKSFGFTPEEVGYKAVRPSHNTPTPSYRL